ncbi:MAG TPA: SDR family oxidoreductase [bacterium]|nr:SDR family oxidoreductase [bacterium]
MDKKNSSDKFLAGKVALITGGTTGIGRATAVALAHQGADVFVFGRHQNKLDDAIADIKKISGREAFGLCADVSKIDDIKNVFKRIDDKFGKIDFLINNASLGARSILDQDFENMDYVLDVNIKGYLLCTRYALDRMIPVKSGHIVNIGSMSSEVREGDADIYVATKSAIAGFNESLRKKVRSQGIKVTLIKPGSVGTDMVTETVQEQVEAQEKRLLLKAEDVANCILFALLQSDRCEIIDIGLKPHYQPF